MKKKSLMLIVLFISMLFIFILTGCTGLYNSSGPDKVYVGTLGIVVEFFKSNPTTVFENDDFALAFFVKNEGAYDINATNPGNFFLSFDNYYLSLNGSKTENIALGGHSLTNPEGDEKYFEFLFNAKNLNSLRESVKTRVNFNICYPYRTEMSTAVCVDTRINSPDTSVDACKLQIYSDSGGQGAPIVVTKVEPEMMIYNKNLVKPQYKISIANSGKGYVINRKTDTDRVCDSINLNRTSPNLDKVTVRAFLSNKELVCDPAELRLQEGQDNFVRCAVSDANVADYSRTNRNYVAPLTVRVDYGYVQVIPYDIEIKRKYQVDDPAADCGYYETYINGQCISKCDYCAKNPGSSNCTKLPVGTVASFKFDSGFSCSCSKTKCSELAPYGLCTFGFCPGSEYCCKSSECIGIADGTQCGDNHVCINSTCSPRITECEYNHGNSSVTNYTCADVSKCQPDKVERGLCPGAVNMVCCLPVGKG